MSEATLFLSQYWLLEQSCPASVVHSCLFELIEKVITTDSLFLAMKKKTRKRAALDRNADERGLVQPALLPSKSRAAISV
jgi:hypothetical protein